MVLSLFALNAKKGRYADMWNIQTEQEDEDEDDTKEETVISRNDSEQFNFVGTEQVVLLKWEVLPLNTPTLLGSYKCEIETASGGNDESEKQTQIFLNILI